MRFSTRLPTTIFCLGFLAACIGGEDGPKESGESGGERTCEVILAEFEAETTAIRSCTSADECGQELTGTSCGCTRNWVARTDADTTTFYALIAESNALSCDLSLGSTCDCPEADGYACVDDVCTWNYVSGM